MDNSCVSSSHVRLAMSIRKSFVTIHESVESEDGYTPIHKSWRVDIAFGHRSIRTTSFDRQDAAENYADNVAEILAWMIHSLAPGSLPVESPHFDIVAERKRQCSLGFTVLHDDTHSQGELALAAAVYAIPYYMRAPDVVEHLWPFDDLSAPKPDEAKRYAELVKAGALIVAEMSRLNRERIAKENQ